MHYLPAKESSISRTLAEDLTALEACFNIYVETCIEIELKHAKKAETDKTEEAIKNQS